MIKWVRSLSLIHQIGAVVLLGFVISFYLSLNLLSSESTRTLNLLSSSSAVQRVTTMIELLGQTPESLHPTVLEASSSYDLTLSITTQPHIKETKNLSKATNQLIAKFKAKEIDNVNLLLVERARPLTDMHDMRNAMMSGISMQERRALRMGYLATIDGSVQLQNGKWLNFSSGIREDVTHWSTSVVFALCMVMLVTITLAISIIHRALKPIQTLREAASDFAISRKVTSIEADGPKDLVPTIEAFNKMQVDISDFIQERTRLIAAISHDLRTPLTSLRLRLEFAEESNDKEQMLNSVSIMEKMLKATMSFAKNDSDIEERQQTNIDSLLQTIVDEYSDRSVVVKYQSTGCIAENIPPITVRRMIENLVNNAVQYGGNIARFH
ncbi:histidine kinase dimerization/phospho-acceptor domain-containing protein [Vibrio hannami]|uniref:histidine kinase dimerization/phospho-acceptor domain-containing protein n=1 Tax=Vibrio hannami TaxID=2717094 RepID=UPI00240FDEAE|nr:histidine kinase dimerization/phospho-acceptor domain-containing protein [Vibrio hannami]MDG3084985.1 histidine kinase dimerization/phospho-acceptor domain-containing protein [Vibrio hannami]